MNKINQKIIVVALGGNALGNNPENQLKIVKNTAKNLINLILKGNKIVIVHGNGPQIGMINSSFEESNKINQKNPIMPFPECAAMSQGYIGYHLQQAFENELKKKKEAISLLYEKKPTFISIITQTIIDKNDPAFNNPTKPIGNFYHDKNEVKKLKEKWSMIEDSGRGWRRVVPSPLPKKIVEENIILKLINENIIPIIGGGGGIPVIEENNVIKGIAAVIDKDFVASLIAKIIKADELIILTAVKYVSINYNEPNEIKIKKITKEEVNNYINKGYFDKGKGSILPKLKAAVDFLENNKSGKVIITSLNNIEELLKKNEATIIFNKNNNF
jgi:carbamate kinase